MKKDSSVFKEETNRPINTATPVEERVTVLKQQHAQKWVEQRKTRGPHISGIHLDNMPISFMQGM